MDRNVAASIVAEEYSLVVAGGERSIPKAAAKYGKPCKRKTDCFMTDDLTKQQ